MDRKNNGVTSDDSVTKSNSNQAHFGNSDSFKRNTDIQPVALKASSKYSPTEVVKLTN